MVYTYNGILPPSGRSQLMRHLRLAPPPGADTSKKQNKRNKSRTTQKITLPLILLSTMKRVAVAIAASSPCLPAGVPSYGSMTQALKILAGYFRDSEYWAEIKHSFTGTRG
jgi:hypothetical protein